jgi:hypothetical protein
MGDLVTKMPEQSSVGLPHLATTTLPLGIIRLCKINCDHAIGVTCHHGRSTGRRRGIICQKVKSQSIWVFRFGPNW